MIPQHYNDGSQNPPRLYCAQSMWALSKLPMNAAQEWTLEEKCARVKEAGIEGIEINATVAADERVVETLNSYGLKTSIVLQGSTIEAARKAIEQAAAIKSAYVWQQPATAFTPIDEVVTLITESRRIAADHGLCLFVETHRNNFTENLPQCRALIERLPDIRFTGDLSHLVLIGEFYGWEDEHAADHLAPILERIAHLHGRISNGEQIQVDVGDGSGQTAQFFVKLWTIAMRHWLKDAGPGDIFPFASELGAPRYAITLPDGREFSDRWEQSLVMKRLAEQAWAEANA